MTAIIAILEASDDGTLHVPVPDELRCEKIEIIATLRAAGHGWSQVPPPVATPEMLKPRGDAFAAVRNLDPFAAVSDPGQWQREVRIDRPIAGRD